MADAEAPKRRTFRKFTYRGVDLEQLLDMGTEELTELLPARARRKLQRGLKRKPLALIKKLRNAKKTAEAGEAPWRRPVASFYTMTPIDFEVSGTWDRRRSRWGVTGSNPARWNSSNSRSVRPIGYQQRWYSEMEPVDQLFD